MQACAIIERHRLILLSLPGVHHSTGYANVNHGPYVRTHMATPRANASCVPCPACLSSISQCGRQIREVHKDCRVSKLLCTRGVWECPATGFFWTYPMLTDEQLGGLYSNHSGGMTRSLSSTHPRIVGQYAFITQHAHEQLGRQELVVVEIGCNQGVLLAMFGGPGRTLVCFEHSFQSSPSRMASVKASLEATGSRAFVFDSGFSVHTLQASVGRSIDLFLSSHVLEHLPDLCSFFANLFIVMSSRGAVFSEIPNHSAKIVRTLRGWRGGLFHISYPTPRSLLLIMEQSGFQFGAMRSLNSYNTTGINGGLFRSMLFRPARHAHRWELDV